MTEVRAILTCSCAVREGAKAAQERYAVTEGEVSDLLYRYKTDDVFFDLVDSEIDTRALSVARQLAAFQDLALRRACDIAGEERSVASLIKAISEAASIAGTHKGIKQAIESAPRVVFSVPPEMLVPRTEDVD